MKTEYDFSKAERGKSYDPDTEFSFLVNVEPSENEAKRKPEIGWEKQTMETTKYVYWQEEDMWLGYLEAYPDYWTQGETTKELEENLRDIYLELGSGTIPCLA